MFGTPQEMIDEERDYLDSLKPQPSKKIIISWWSGGITSAITCKLCIDLFGLDSCRFIFIDTHNEDDDTYRFKSDCEKWYGKEIETITEIGKEYNSIQEIWYKHKSLNVATGAICSTILKRKARERWQKENEYDYQAFGFEFDEHKRAKSLVVNHKKAKAIFPLIMFGYSKKDCLDILEENNIKVPVVYEYGY